MFGTTKGRVICQFLAGVEICTKTYIQTYRQIPFIKKYGKFLICTNFDPSLKNWQIPLYLYYTSVITSHINC
jgi:hypothetical protein